MLILDRDESGFVGWNIYSMTRFYLETLSIDTEYDPTMDSPQHSALPLSICKSDKTSLVSKLLPDLALEHPLSSILMRSCAKWAIV